MKIVRGWRCEVEALLLSGAENGLTSLEPKADSA
jgi:hypothetical protein